MLKTLTSRVRRSRCTNLSFPTLVLVGCAAFSAPTRASANPGVIISAPGSNARLTVPLTVNGTATDASSPINHVNVTLTKTALDSTSTLYWTGSAWSSTLTSITATQSSPDGSGQVSWSVASSSLPSSATDWVTGRYQLKVAATNNASSTTTVSENFYSGTDTSAPTLTYSTPAANDILTSLSGPTGTVTDAGGITRVMATLQRTNSSGAAEFWSVDPVTSVGSWGPTSQNFFGAITHNISPDTDRTDESWTINGTWPTGTDLPSGTYTWRVSAYDRSENSVNISRPIGISPDDTTNPTVALTSPTLGTSLTGWTGAVSGGAQDSGSGVGRVNVALTRSWNGSTEYFNGTGWTTTFSPTWATLTTPDGTGALTWSATIPGLTTYALPAGSYSIRAQAFDRYSNGATITPSYTAGTVDTTNPVTTITVPAASATVDRLPLLSGTATDETGGSGLSRVIVQLSHLFSSGGTNTRKFWTGSAWTTTVTNLATFVMPETPLTPSYNWSVTSGLPAGTDLAAGSNTVKAWCFDRFGNQSVSVTRDFTTIPNTAPTANAGAADVAFNTAAPITLSGTDAEGDPLTYSIVSAPANGGLSGSGASWTYSPSVDYSGTDSFTFKVSDGLLDSATATVTLTVHALGYIGPASSLTATPQDGRIRLSWTAGTGAAYYQIRRRNQDSGPYTTVEEVSGGTDYTDSTTLNGKEYFYVVKSAFKDGYGHVHTAADSNEAGGIPGPQPSPPLALTAEGNYQCARLQWQNSQRAETYEIWRSVGGATWAKLVTVAAANGTFGMYDDLGLTNGTGYSYFVRALNGSVQTIDSNEVSVVPKAEPPAAPDAPVFTTVKHDSVAIVAPILPVGAQSLTLEEGGVTGFAPLLTGLTGGQVSTLTELHPGSHTFRYTAVGLGGSTPGASANLNIEGLPDAPGAVRFEFVTSTEYAVISPQLPNHSGNVDNYNWNHSLVLQQKQADGSWTDVTSDPTVVFGLEVFWFDGVSPGTFHTFRCRAYNSQGEYADGPEGTVQAAPGAPVAPVVISAGDSSFVVRDVAAGGTPPALPVGASSLTLQKQLTNGTWTDVAEGLTGNAEAVVSGLIPDWTYHVRYVAVGASGSTPGNDATATTATGTTTAPAAPDLDVLSPNVVIVYRNASYADLLNTWTLQQRTEDGEFSDVGTVYGANSEYAYGLAAGTKYYFRWVDQDGNLGAPASATTAPAEPPAPTVVQGTGYSLRVTVPGAASGVETYTLYMGSADDGSGLPYATGVLPGDTVTVDNLTPGDAYNFSVYAVGPDASTPGPSASGEVMTHPIAEQEPPLVLEVKSTSIRVMRTVPITTSPPSTLHLQYKASGATTWDELPIDDDDWVITGLPSSTEYEFRFRIFGYGDDVFSCVKTATTLPAAPDAPPAPTFPLVGTDSVTIDVPAMPAHATSLDLWELGTGSYRIVRTNVDTSVPGTTILIDSLVPGAEYRFRWAANGPGGTTLSNESYVTLLTGPVPAPGVPTFAEITDNSIEVVSPEIPDSSLHLQLALQMKQTGQPDTTYTTMASNVAGNSITRIDSLVPGTSYDFRFVQSSSTDSAIGDSASASTVTPVVSWNAGQGIGCAGIRYPITGATFARGQTVRLSSGLATDWDQLSRSINGHEFLKDVTDPCGYLWTCSGGTFVTGGAGGIDNTSSPPRATGATVLWQAPTTAGTYTLTLAVMDQSQAGNIVSGQFHNNRSDSEGGSRSDPIRGYPDEPLHFTVTVTVGP